MGVKLTRRDFLVLAAGGAAVTLGRRLIPYSGTGAAGGIVAPPSYDEEFNGENVEWTIVVAGTGDYGVTTPGKIHLHNDRAIRTRVPTPPFTVTAYCSSLLYDDIYSQYANASLAVGGAANAATTGDRHYALQWDVAYLGEIGIIDGTWDDYSTQVHQNSYTKFGDDLAFQIPHYQRLVVASGTDISSYYSTDGVNWTLYLANYNPGVDVEAVLLLSYGCTTEWDWVRFS